MNKLLKVTLITAIMATSGMCSDRCQQDQSKNIPCMDQNSYGYNPYPSQSYQTPMIPVMSHCSTCSTCGIVLSGIVAVGGYFIYKNLKERIENLNTVVNDRVDYLEDIVTGGTVVVTGSTVVNDQGQEESEQGLVKDVADLKPTVGDDNSGLVSQVTTLENTVGDDNSGLVKKIQDHIADTTTAHQSVE